MTGSLHPGGRVLGRLVGIQGPNLGESYEVSDLCILGRALDCEVQIRDLTVSRRHARVLRENNRFVVEDLGSGNGTFVNDEEVRRHFLSDGDVVEVCSARFRFEESREAIESVTVVGPLPGSRPAPQVVKVVDARVPVLKRDAQNLSQENRPEELRAMSRRLETTYRVSEAISSILDVEELLPEIVDRVLEVFGPAERALAFIHDREEKAFVPRFVRRRNEDASDELKISSTILDDVVSNQRAVLTHDALQDARFKGGRSVANIGIRAMMAAPLVWRDEVLGVLYLDSNGIASFDQADLELLTTIAGQCAVALGNAYLHTELMKRQAMEQDLMLAQQIQQSFLPRQLPVRGGFTFASRYEPCYAVGGDFYDFIDLGEERLGIVVGDVSGKGFGAALYMARLTRDLRQYATSTSDPAEVLGKMNQAVLDFDQDDMFVTLIYAVLDPETRTLTLASAGHMPTLVRRAGGSQVDSLDDEGGLPLGVLPSAGFESCQVVLRPGDTVLLYSDGLVEAMSPDRQMFGIERLKEAVAHGPSEAPALLERAHAACQTHVADAAQFDDTTMLAVGASREDPSERTHSAIPPVTD